MIEPAAGQREQRRAARAARTAGRNATSAGSAVRRRGRPRRSRMVHGPPLLTLAPCSRVFNPIAHALLLACSTPLPCSRVFNRSQPCSTVFNPTGRRRRLKDLDDESDEEGGGGAGGGKKKPPKDVKLLQRQDKFFEGQEDAEVLEEDGNRIEPFNMNEELEEGFVSLRSHVRALCPVPDTATARARNLPGCSDFDETGNYMRKKTANQFRDAWFDSITGSDIKKVRLPASCARVPCSASGACSVAVCEAASGRSHTDMACGLCACTGPERRCQDAKGRGRRGAPGSHAGQPAAAHPRGRRPAPRRRDAHDGTTTETPTPLLAPACRPSSPPPFTAPARRPRLPPPHAAPARRFRSPPPLAAPARRPYAPPRRPADLRAWDGRAGPCAARAQANVGRGAGPVGRPQRHGRTFSHERTPPLLVRRAPDLMSGGMSGRARAHRWMRTLSGRTRSARSSTISPRHATSSWASANTVRACFQRRGQGRGDDPTLIVHVQVVCASRRHLPGTPGGAPHPAARTSGSGTHRSRRYGSTRAKTRTAPRMCDRLTRWAVPPRCT